MKYGMEMNMLLLERIWQNICFQIFADNAIGLKNRDFNKNERFR